MNKRLIVLILALTLCLTGCTSAGNNTTVEQVTEQETVVAKPYVRSLGVENLDARKVAVINNTGKTITYFSLDEYHPYSLETQIQLALIEQEYLYGGADGEIGPLTLEAIDRYREDNDLPEGTIDAELIGSLLGEEYTRNLLQDGERFLDGTARNLYYLIPEENMENQEDPVAEIMKKYSVSCDQVVSLYFEDEEGSSVLHAFPADHADEIQIRMEGDIPYVVYDSEEIEIPVTTLQIEKAIWEEVQTSSDDELKDEAEE